MRPYSRVVAVEAFLSAGEVVQADHPAVRAMAARLRDGHAGDAGFSRAAYEFVRDEVRHSFDVDDPRVTVTAAEVLEHRVGLCYAKSHLLAALLRAEGVPAGLCYQRLATAGGGFVLHGLVAVHLDGRWHRQDPRGNKPGVDAQFSLDGPRLAFAVDAAAGECDYDAVCVVPDAGVLAALRATTDVLTLRTAGLPSDLRQA
jgi:transglutaminase-like putative cysteine protease